MSISNESIETTMHMSNLRDIIVKSVDSNKELNEVKYVTTEIVNLHPPTHLAFVSALVTQDQHHRVIPESLAFKCMMSLNSAADIIQFNTQKLI